VFIGYATFDTVLGGDLFNTTIRTGTQFSFVLFIPLALALTAIGYDLVHRLSRWSLAWLSLRSCSFQMVDAKVSPVRSYTSTGSSTGILTYGVNLRDGSRYERCFRDVSCRCHTAPAWRR
jgi:purine-cytosine permease-like protein